MDPKGVYRESWEDINPLTGQPWTVGGRPAYARVVTYNDGTIERIFYARNSAGPDGQDQEIGRQVVGVDADRQRWWQQEQQNRQPPGGRQFVVQDTPTGKRVFQWNPDTGQYDKDVGPAPESNSVTSITQDDQGNWWGLRDGQWVKLEGGPQKSVKNQPVTNITQDKKTGKWYGIQNGQWVEIEGPGPSQTGKQYSTVRQDDQGTWWGLTPEGTWEQIPGGPGKPAKETQIIEVDGQKVEVIRNPDGSIKELRPVQVSGKSPPASAAGWTPDPSKPAFGLIERYQDLLRRVEAGEIDREQAKQLYEQDRNAAQAYAQQLAASGQAAAGVYREQVSQREQDISAANARLRAASEGFQSALSAGLKINQDLPAGSDLGGKAIVGLMALNAANAAGLGGLQTPPQVPVPAALQQLMTMTLPNGVRLDVPLSPAAPGLPAGGGQTAPGLDLGPQIGPSQTPQPVQRPTAPEQNIFAGLDRDLANIFGPDIVAEANRRLLGELGLGSS